MSNSPNNGLINETNEQYYVGHQAKVADGSTSYTYTFDEVLKMADAAAPLTPTDWSSWNPSDPNFMLNNFDLMVSTGGLNPYVLWDGMNGGMVGTFGFKVSNFSETQDWSTIEFYDTATGLPAVAVATGYYIQVRLKSSLVDGAPNYGDYQYTSLKDVINNFLVGYVGDGKIISSAKRSDVMFHAKRGLQEFSYDTLKVMKSQELTIPPTLSVIMPQDYVNYVQLSWIDDNGVKRIIYPTTLTSNPMEKPLQDNNITDNSNYGFSFPSEGYGIPMQDQFGENLDGTSMTEERWESVHPFLQQQWDDYGSIWSERREWGLLGQRYGLQPELAQSNGWFTINDREGKFSFSSNLREKLIILEYISDGLAYNEDAKIPKMAEEALYMHIAYSILSTRVGVNEYVVQRFKKDRRAALRNAKIRLSNTKLNEFIQILRGKSKWIK
ncbi:MAG: hypothetical protein GY787_14730 [Alteromonadales bacterium]|nr:hypothetical protein [Alteromonadales bacterium]